MFPKRGLNTKVDRGEIKIGGVVSPHGELGGICGRPGRISAAEKFNYDLQESRPGVLKAIFGAGK